MKKSISLILALVIALSVFSLSAFAADTKTETLFDAIEDEKEVTINFRRNYKDSYNTDDKSIFCYDADLLTGRRINGFQVPVMWPIVPFGYLFSLELDDFITCYKKSAKKLGASRMKDIMITHSKNNLNVRLFF